MKTFGIAMALAVLLCGGQALAQAPTPAAAIGPGPTARGVFSIKKTGNRLHLAVAGHNFTSRDAIEKYLAYRAAEQTLAAKMAWFSFLEQRSRNDKVPVPKGDPAGPRFSFRLEFFRPLWRYKTGGSVAWKAWSPFSGTDFFVPNVDPKTITDFEVTADVALRSGKVDDVNPLAFDASAVSDYLINQVEAPK
jgi:hypothetical protein